MALVTFRARVGGVLLRGLTWAVAGAALACGDSLVDTAYLGTPRFSVDGKVVGNSEHVDENHPDVTVAVFWSRKGQQPGPGEDTLVEQPGTALQAEYFRPFVMRLFDEPAADALFTRPSGARFGVAYLAAWQDVNGNGHKDDTEPLIGSPDGRAVIRAPQPLSAQDSPTGAPLPEGWHVVSTPLSCPWVTGPQPGGASPGGAADAGVNPVPVADGDCGVPLGHECKNDGECNGGVCVHEFLGPWPAGACLIPEPPPNGCRQRGSVLLKAPDGTAQAYWLKSCEVSDDCGRIPPYQCDQQLRACRPSSEVPVELNDHPPPRSFCEPPAPPSPP